MIILCRIKSERRNVTREGGPQGGNSMVFSLSLRQTSNGTIEAGPSSSTLSAFREYITTWDFSDRAALIRRLACTLAFALHIPLNILSILSWGFLFMFMGIVLSLANLACVGAALWKLDIMSGERQFYGRS
jgi:hypothetical protein